MTAAGAGPDSLVPRDGVPGNRHPLNLRPAGSGSGNGEPGAEGRLPIYEVYMRMAEELARRSTCARLQVGTVITDRHLESVVAIGYNGNARGLPNRCDAPDTPGRCGCIHSEMNALVKAPGRMRHKVAFVTASPCVMCAKLMVQARVAWLFYRTPYRDASGLEVLREAGVGVVEYTRWKDAWRGGTGGSSAVDAGPISRESPRGAAGPPAFPPAGGPPTSAPSP